MINQGPKNLVDSSYHLKNEITINMITMKISYNLKGKSKRLETKIILESKKTDFLGSFQDELKKELTNIVHLIEIYDSMQPNPINLEINFEVSNTDFKYAKKHEKNLEIVSNWNIAISRLRHILCNYSIYE